MRTAAFRMRIMAWYRASGRHDLPWRRTRDPYAVLVSEIMLQQTPVNRVRLYFEPFRKRFPNPSALARAPLGDVIALWRGLGYNRRAAFLQRAAAAILRDHGGAVPADVRDLERLPGVGRSTAGAIRAFGYDRSAVFIETNIRRVFLHFFFSKRDNVTDAEIMPVIRRTLPRRGFRAWYYALMDYGSGALGGIENPNRRSAHYARQPRFEGSRRQMRGRILAAIGTRERTPAAALSEAALAGKNTPVMQRLFREALDSLRKDGMLTERNGLVSIGRTHV